MCGAGVLWGTGGLVVTVLHARDGLAAMTVSAWRMALAAVALLGFAVATRRWGGVLATGWGHATARTRPSGKELGVLTAALSGLLLITVTAGHGSAAPGEQPGRGLVLAVLAGATYAATTVLGHTLAQRVDPVALTTCATAAGAVALLPFLGVDAAAGEPVLALNPLSLALLVYLGVATMALAYGLLYAGLRSTSGSAATIATLVEPLSAAVFAAGLLGERLAWPALLGGALILAAVVALRPSDEHPAPA